MPRKKETVPCERIIYILLSPAGKKFYIGQCAKKAARETYRHTIKGRRESTCKLIEAIAPNRPCFFILETFQGDMHHAKNLIVAWIKIFLENNYISYNQPAIIEMTENLYIDTNTLYEERKAINLKKITSCENCALPRFNREICERYPFETVEEELKTNKTNKLSFLSLSNKDYEIISEHAKKLGMPVAAYIRTAAKNPKIVQLDYSSINKHTREIAEIRNSINRLVFTIEATNNYLPREIESIVNMMNDIFQGENILIKTMREMRDSL